MGQPRSWAAASNLSAWGAVVPSIRWSQWMVEGTAVVGSPEEMNCSTAICAVASCIATRSAQDHTTSQRPRAGDATTPAGAGRSQQAGGAAARGAPGRRRR